MAGLDDVDKLKKLFPKGQSLGDSIFVDVLHGNQGSFESARQMLSEMFPPDEVIDISQPPQYTDPAVLQMFGQMQRGNYDLLLSNEELVVMQRADYKGQLSDLPSGHWCFLGNTGRLGSRPPRAARLGQLRAVPSDRSLSVAASSLRLRAGTVRFSRRLLGVQQSLQSSAKLAAVGGLLVLPALDPPRPFIVDPDTLEPLGQLQSEAFMGDNVVSLSSPVEHNKLWIFSQIRHTEGVNELSLVLSSPDSGESRRFALRDAKLNSRVSVPPNSAHFCLRGAHWLAVVVSGLEQPLALHFLPLPLLAEALRLPAHAQDLPVHCHSLPSFRGAVRDGFFSREEAGGRQVGLQLLGSWGFLQDGRLQQGEPLRGGGRAGPESDGLPGTDQTPLSRGSDLRLLALQPAAPHLPPLESRPLPCVRGTLRAVRLSLPAAEGEEEGEGAWWVGQGTWPELDSSRLAAFWGLPAAVPSEREPAGIFSAGADGQVLCGWTAASPTWLAGICRLPRERGGFVLAAAWRVAEQEGQRGGVQELYVFDPVRDGLRAGPAFVIQPAPGFEFGLGLSEFEGVWVDESD